MKNFDNSQEGGRLLNQDLQLLFRKHGQDHICMAITFPDDYPTHPFFVRWVCAIWNELGAMFLEYPAGFAEQVNARTACL